MTHLKQKTKERLDHYLFRNKLNESCYFSNNEVVGFHWANDKVAADFYRNQYGENKAKFHERVEALRGELDNLKHFNIWLMSKRGQVKTTIYNLYKCYLDPRLKYQWFDLDDILVSTQHEAGPFCSVKSMRWFDKEIFSKFIYLKMLEDNVPQRNFRLSLNIPLEMRADGSPFGAIKARISQLTNHGLLVNFSNGNPIKEWSQREVSFLKKSMSLKEDEMVSDIFRSDEWVSAIENFTMRGDLLAQKVEEGIKKQGENNHFIFVSFDEISMLSVKGHDKSVNHLRSLFGEVKGIIHEHIKAA